MSKTQSETEEYLQNYKRHENKINLIPPIIESNDLIFNNYNKGLNIKELMKNKVLQLRENNFLTNNLKKYKIAQNSHRLKENLPQLNHNNNINIIEYLEKDKLIKTPRFTKRIIFSQINDKLNEPRSITISPEKNKLLNTGRKTLDDLVTKEDHESINYSN